MTEYIRLGIIVTNAPAADAVEEEFFVEGMRMPLSPLRAGEVAAEVAHYALSVGDAPLSDPEMSALETYLQDEDDGRLYSVFH